MQSLSNAGLVSKVWKQVIQEEKIWTLLLEQEVNFYNFYVIYVILAKMFSRLQPNLRGNKFTTTCQFNQVNLAEMILTAVGHTTK